jgi:hypothetical protein
MISLTQLFQKVMFTEETEEEHLQGVGHLPHVVERAIEGHPHEATEYLENALRFVENKPTEGTISQKADGKVSVYFGKEDGIPFVRTKHGGKDPVVLYTKDEIDHHVKTQNKEYLRDSLMMGLEAASHPKVGDNITYQADTLIDDGEHLKGNIIRYKKPSKNTTAALAVHTVLDSKTKKKIGSAPDLSELESNKFHFPNLGMKGKLHAPKPEELEAIRYHIGAAQRLFANRKVMKAVQDIATDEDPGLKIKHEALRAKGKTPDPSKLRHRAEFFRGFNNAVQRGDYDHLGDGNSIARSVQLFMTHAEKKKANTENKEEKKRIDRHIEFAKKNADAVHAMLQAHNHIDSARDHVINILNRSKPGLKPIDPKTGKVNQNFSEGWVSELPGMQPVKFVPGHFTKKNASESAARKKKQEPLQENEGGMVMTASGGGIAGMGYDRGGPAPDDVAVPPLENKMASKNAKPFRRKLLTKLLKRMPVGRESY